MDQLKYVTVKQMRELENAAVVRDGIALATLMENAGRAVANEARCTAKKDGVIIFAGYGNNGGDGMVAARYLIKDAYGVKIFLVGRPKPFSPETNANYSALIELGYKPQEISLAEEIDKAFENIAQPASIIDAIFGIGLRGILSDFYIKLIDKINNSGLPIISADIPSGLDADTGEPLGRAVKAAKTVTFGYPKAGFKNPKAKVYTGEVVVADIGLPKID